MEGVKNFVVKQHVRLFKRMKKSLKIKNFFINDLETTTYENSRQFNGS